MDLNSINANINRLLTNIWAVISFLKEFAVDGAKDVSITYINADGSESVRTLPNIAKWRAMVQPERNYISFQTASFSKNDSPTPITSLNNTDNPQFSVSDNKTIVFKRSGMYMIDVNILCKASDIEDDGTPRVGFIDGKYAIAEKTIDANWVRVSLTKEHRYSANDSVYLRYFDSSFGTWADFDVSFISIIRLGD